MQCSLKLKDLYVALMRKENNNSVFKLVTVYHDRRMVGTGFIGYMKLRDNYAAVFITNNHVITTEEDAMGSRITFENPPPGSKHVLQGFRLFKRSGLWFSPENEVIHAYVKHVIHYYVLYTLYMTE